MVHLELERCPPEASLVFADNTDSSIPFASKLHALQLLEEGFESGVLVAVESLVPICVMIPEELLCCVPRRRQLLPAYADATPDSCFLFSSTFQL